MGERETGKRQTPFSLGPDPPQEQSSTTEERQSQLQRLQETVTVCPTDLGTRCELATLLEKLGQPVEALCHWKAVLACNPNHLEAWEGVARCREKLAQALQRHVLK